MTEQPSTKYTEMTSALFDYVVDLLAAREDETRLLKRIRTFLGVPDDEPTPDNLAMDAFSAVTWPELPAGAPKELADAIFGLEDDVLRSWLA